METLGKYRLLRRLAVGGMAEIFLAEQPGPAGLPARHVAIKRILPHRADDAEFVEMFRNEARVASLLNHPHIVQIFDMGEVGDTYFIAMEYVEGYDLGQVLDRAEELRQPLDSVMVARIIAQAAAGLHYAHSYLDPRTQQPLSLIHRDISLPNIMVSLDGGVKVLDFGIAKASIMENRKQTQTGILKGKVSYMSPEYLRGNPIDQRHDLFALGVAMYEMLTTQKPFRAKGEVQMLQAILTQAPQDPYAFRPDLPRPLYDIMMKALANDPNQRYQQGGELEADLEAFIAQQHGEFSQQELAQQIQVLFQGSGIGGANQPEPSMQSFSLRQSTPPSTNTPANRRPTSAFQAQSPNDMQALAASIAPDAAMGSWEETRALNLNGFTETAQEDQRPLLAPTQASPVYQPDPTPTAMLKIGDGVVENLIPSGDAPDATSSIAEAMQATSNLAETPPLPSASPMLQPPPANLSELVAASQTSLPQAGEDEEDSVMWTLVALVLVLGLFGGGGYYAYKRWFAVPVVTVPADAGGETLRATAPGIRPRVAVRRRAVKSRTRPVVKRQVGSIQVLARRTAPRPRVPVRGPVRRTPPRNNVPDARVTERRKPPLPRDDESATLVLRSRPSCSVYMAGYRMGSTPLRTKLPPGSYRLHLRRRKPYINMPITVGLGKGQEIERSIRIRRSRLQIKVTPFPAKVYVDGNYIGISPVPALDLYEGVHRIKIFNEEKMSRPKTRSVYVRYRRTTKVYTIRVP